MLLTGLTLVTLVAIFPRQTLVLTLIAGGKLIAPEGSAILTHYCFGNGDTLQLSPDYIRQSPVVLRALRTLSEGGIKRVTFNQKEDWRLSYALNPFYITQSKGECVIYQHIAFATDKTTFTVLNLFGLKLTVPDNIVHAFDCKPFVATCRFSA